MKIGEGGDKGILYSGVKFWSISSIGFSSVRYRDPRPWFWSCSVEDHESEIGSEKKIYIVDL